LNKIATILAIICVSLESQIPQPMFGTLGDFRDPAKFGSDFQKNIGLTKQKKVVEVFIFSVIFIKFSIWFCVTY